MCVGHNFWLRVAMCHRIGLIDEPLAVRTWLKDSLTRAKKARVFRIKAEMLHRFYEEQGGQHRLDPPRARRALAKACWRAGQLARREGDWSLATRCFYGATYYGRTMRARFMLLYANWQRARRNLPMLESRDAA